LDLNKTGINKPRIKDIAAKANVSTGTVDRVLHNRGEVAEETRLYVLSIIEKMGYTPNILAKSLASKKIYRIAVLIPGAAFDNPYWEKPLNGIQRAVEEIKDYNTIISIYNFDLNSESSFINECDTLLKSEFDGLIFTPLFHEISERLIAYCEKKGIPYLFIDINLDNKNNLAYFGQNAFQSGYLAAKLMDFGIDNHSDILILKLLQPGTISQHLVKREAGFTSYFKSNHLKKKVKLISIDTNFTKEVTITTVLDEEFSKSHNIKGIFVTNSRAFKVAEYLEGSKKSNILLIGYDIIDRNLYYLEKGIINFLIGQKPEEQGYLSIMTLFNHLLLKKEVEKINYSPIDIIMKENISYYNKI
jgi:LacI family transcriptional regulator